MKNKKIRYSVLFLLLLASGLSLGMIFSSPKETIDTEDFNEPKSSAGEITIITPENITYTGPMSGYYPASYGFENELTGTTSTDIKFVDYDQGESNTKAEVIDEYQGHKKVLNCSVDSGVSYLHVYNNFTSPQTLGSIEFWWLISDASKHGHIYFEEAWEDANIHFYIDNGNFVWYDGSAHILASANSNQWYRNIIIFNCTSDKFTWEIYYANGTLHASDLNCNFRSVASTINEFRISTWEATTWFMCFDAICYSWDPSYSIGDNLNEGLILSYDNTTTLEWQGYSLDGQSNRTILGNTTIPMPADGLHTIQVFGNDSVGTMYESNLRYFTVNTAPPDITINSPTDSQIIGSIAPSYDISIVGLYDSLWYALEGGTNYTASGLTGTINQAAWTALADGIITIDFYANNSAGMESTAQVMVIKDSSEEPPPTPPGIPGYNLIALIGVSVAVALILAKRKRKK